MSEQRWAEGRSGQRRVVKLTAVMCCVWIVATLSSAVLQAGSAEASLAPWSTVPSPNPSNAVNGGVLSAISCASATNCMAVGNFEGDNGGNDESTLIESWDGTAWSIVPSPNVSFDDGLLDNLEGVSCYSANDCTAVGWEWTSEIPEESSQQGSSQALIESWNGTAWSIAPSPSLLDSALSGVSCLTASNCIAVGTYEDGTLVESWDGTAWSIIPSPNPSGNPHLNGVSCVSATTCTAVGYYFDGTGSATLVETWDGTAWSIIPSPNPSGNPQLNGVSCVSATTCTAVGYSSSGNGAQTLVESWDGTAWSIAPSPNPSPTANYFAAVSCYSANDCTGVGWEQNEAGSDNALVESWDGNTWSDVPSYDSNNYSQLNGVACPTVSGCTGVGIGSDGTLVEIGPGPNVGITSADSATFTPGLPQSFTVVTGTPAEEPLPSITESGTLPSDLTFTDNGDGSASIAGTPEPSDAGTYSITITASNRVSPDATQDFTLTILPIAITTTSLPTATIEEPYSANLSVVGGTPPYTWSAEFFFFCPTSGNPSSCLPPGLSLNTSTGAITGTPTAFGSWSFWVTVTDSSSPELSATEQLTITVPGGPVTPAVAIASSPNPAVSGPVVYSVSVTGTGPTPTGTVTVSDGQGGTCSVTLVSGAAGCAITESAADSPYSVTASYSGDGYYAPDSGALTETVDPAIATVLLTPSSDPANQGSVTYTILVTGGGSIPTGSVTVSDGEGGSCSTALSQGLANCTINESGLISPFTITATYSGDQNYGTASASISSGASTTPAPPSFTSTNYVEVRAGSQIHFPIAVSGFPAPRIRETGTLPKGTIFHDNGNGTALISGTAPTTLTTYPMMLTATNTSGTVTQTFFVVVGKPPAFLSTTAVLLKKGKAGSFVVRTIGSPKSRVTESGTLPNGVTFTNKGNGTATLAGTPTVAGVYPITITAVNGIGTGTSQHFTLTVGQAPVFRSTSTTTFAHGVKGMFDVTAVGPPTPSKITESGKLPNGLTFTSKGGGRGTLTGKTSTRGTFTLTFRATNSVGTTSQTFRLVVK